MSNFQRTRSKVWWGDSPPNIGSPIAQQPGWNDRAREEADWEPQLPHWIANQPEQQRNNSGNNVAQLNNAQPNPWPLRHGSPGSHKSQDSGFSDSDSSPPPSQHYISPDNNDTNKSSSSNDSNNNENVTIKRADIPNTPVNKDVVDTAKMSDDVSTGMPTPKPRLRSSSVIQTPYDLQKYYEIHHDEEHMELLRDKDTDEVDKTEPKYPAPRNINKEKYKIDKTSKKTPLKNMNPKSNSTSPSDIEIRVTSPNNTSNKENTPHHSAIQKDAKDITYNKNISSNQSEKDPLKKTFISSVQTTSTKVSKVAKVKDLETSKNKSDENLEIIKLSDHNEIAVNNQPRVRTPISNLPYVPSERVSKVTKSEYRRSMSNEDNIVITTTPKFERNRLNKSLNFEAQQLDQQILDIQEGWHSLSYIDEDEPSEEAQIKTEQIHKPTKALLGKNIMDSLHLKPTKKVGPKAKQRQASKADRAREMFRIFPAKREKPSVVESHAGGVLDGSRVPALGLPRSTDQNSWVIVGYPEQEMLIPNYNERLIATDSDINLKAKDQTEYNNTEIKRVTPPPQFRDTQKRPYETNLNQCQDLAHDSKREKLKEDDGISFVDVQINLACTSTPKMLAPHEFMNAQQTPKSMKKYPRRVNLMGEFNSGLVLNNRDEILYRERSIDQTTLERLCARKPEPVQYWLCDLISSCENECMTTLQSKPLGTEMKAMVSSSSATITGNIKKVQTHGQIIVHQYSDVIRQIEAGKVSEEQICLLVANINEFVLAHSITLNTKPPGETPERWDKIKMSLQKYLQKLIDVGEDVKVELNESNTEWRLVMKHLDTLIEIFLETTKAVLVQQLKTLVSIIEEPPSDMILKSTLTSIGHLAILNEDTESSLHEKCAKIIRSITELPFVDCEVTRALLVAIIESKKSSVKALSLRALATVCVTGEAVKQFEEVGGIEILADILSDPAVPEPQVREAITVLTQITAPWLRGHYDLTQLHLYLNTIVENITNILCRTKCCQLLLLCTACLVNLVRELELEKQERAQEQTTKADLLEVFNQHRTVERLLDAVRKRGPNISVFLQEQTASLLASLSRAPRFVLSLSRSAAASAALVCFARSGPQPQPEPRPHELRAQARLHCHAAEAISRLVVLPDVAQQIVQLEGVPHLIRLVKSQRSRPRADVDPDQVLIHCLKALRSIHAHQPGAFRDYLKEVDDMIRPHLMESLMLYSAKQESYV